MRKLIASAVLALSLTLAACGGSDSTTETKDQCEQAYDAGAGNAATSDRESWLNDCRKELGLR